MSYSGRNDIKLTLTAANGCEGWCWLSRHSEGLSWDDDDGDQTTSAHFDLYDENAEVCDSHEIDGDDWRALEDNGFLDQVLYWTRRGVDLESAISAAIQEEDPETVDGQMQKDIDELARALATLADAAAAYSAEHMGPKALVFDGKIQEARAIASHHLPRSLDT